MRVLTAMVGIPIVLGAILATSIWPTLFLVVLLWCLCFDELSEMVDPARPRFGAIDALWLLLVIVVVVTDFRPVTWTIFWGMFAVGIFGLLKLRPSQQDMPADAAEAPAVRGKNPARFLPLAIGWFTAPLGAVLLIHQNGFGGQVGLFAANWLLVLLIPLWIGDSLAYFVGRAMGRTPLAPSISPKKTVEGALANFYGCVISAMLLGPFLGIEWWRAGLCGAAIGIFGQLGDLAESALKRRYGVKDSGRAIPGHGGALDRLDSLLFSALPVATILLVG